MKLFSDSVFFTDYVKDVANGEVVYGTTMTYANGWVVRFCIDPSSNLVSVSASQPTPEMLEATQIYPNVFCDHFDLTDDLDREVLDVEFFHPAKYEKYKDEVTAAQERLMAATDEYEDAMNEVFSLIYTVKTAKV